MNEISAINNIGLPLRFYTKAPRNDVVRFTSNPAAQTLPEAAPDFAVKTPVSYSKTGETALPFDLKAHCYKLSNGQRVVIVPKEGQTVIKTYVNSGSMNEPDKVRGISHYIEHNLFNGSQGLEEGDFFKFVDKMGASTNASTGFAETNYYISSNLLNEADLENQIKIHASMLETPFFKQEKLDKEKGIVNSELNMILSRPENIGFNRTLKNLYNIDSSSADLIGGTTGNITNLKREDVTDYYNKNYYPANMVTVITGDVQPEDAIKYISKYFSSERKPPQATVHEPLKPIEKTVREDIISDKATATHVFLGFNGPENNNRRDKIHMEALARLLTESAASRINSKIKPLNTSAWLEIEKISTKPDDGKAILVSVETTENNSEQVLKTLFEEIHGVQTNPPTDEEMQIIKKSMLKSFSGLFEYSAGINSHIGQTMLNGSLDSINDYEKIVNAMSAQDLVDAAKKYLDLNKAALTVIHPANASETSINENHKNVSFTGAAAPKHAINPDKVQEYQAHNNFRIVMNDINTRNSYLALNFDADVPLLAKPGVTAILNSILNEGTKFKDDREFKTLLRKNGISSGFGASSGGLAAASSFDADDLKLALTTTKDVILTPRFDEETLKQAKNDVRESLLMAEKSANRNIDAELYKGFTLGHTNKEILENLDNITLEDVQNLYRYIMDNSKASIVVSAPFSKKPELKKTLFDDTAKYSPVKEFKPYLHDMYQEVTETKVLTEADNKNQASIVMAHKFKHNNNLKDEAALNLLNIILGGGPSSRLFSDLRETEKLAYSVRSGVGLVENTGVIKLSIGTTTDNCETASYDNVQKAINGFKRHIEKMKNEKVTDEELNNAKLSLKNDILSSLEGSESKNSTLSSSHATFYGLSQLNQKLEIIDEITADDIQNAAKYIFSGKPLYSIVATENTLKNNEEFLNSLKNAQGFNYAAGIAKWN
ncbi:MAG: insulinase family protein [Heliobacteriaceae bacterium]|jgi:zinc protease|nr:insulinase family protein [Heliobacteriaceae bacterium]